MSSPGPNRPAVFGGVFWNTSGWTYQAYVASEVIQFYTEDWKPYLGLDIFNHKESPIILLEMERAMNFTTGIGRASTGLRQSAREALSSFNASNSA